MPSAFASIRAALTAVSNRLRRAWRSVARSRREKTLLIGFPLAIGLYAAKELIGPALTRIGGWLHMSKDELLVIALAVCAIIGVAAILYRFARPGPSEPLARRKPDELDFHSRFTREMVERIQADVIEPMFPDTYPNEEEIYAMYACNPGMGLGLWSVSEKRYVSFACAWPIKASTARALIAGTRNENSLTRDDVLPASHNRRAEYLLFPVIATLDSESTLGTQRSFRLLYRFKDQVLDTYWGDSERRITLIATGFTKGGLATAKDDLHMTPATKVEIDGKAYPVLVREVSRSEFRRLHYA